MPDLFAKEICFGKFQTFLGHMKSTDSKQNNKIRNIFFILIILTTARKNINIDIVYISHHYS